MKETNYTLLGKLKSVFTGFTNENYSHAWELKGGTPGFFPLASYVENMGFKCKWRLQHTMENSFIEFCTICITDALQRNREGVG